MVEQRAGNAAIKARTGGAEGVYAGRTPAGEPVVTAFYRSRDTNWSAHVSIPLSIYNAPLNRAIAWLAGLIVAALVLTLIFAHLFRRELLVAREDALARERAGRLEALGRMTGGVAHDINNVLDVILSGIALIQRRHPKSELLRYLTPMAEAAEKGARTTQSLLAFSRGGSGRKEVVEVDRHLKEIEFLLRQALRGNIKLFLELGAGGSHVAVDEAQLDLALLNLVTNARDALPNGGTMTVRTRLEDEVVTIEVHDDGTGIAPEDLPLVFEPFFTTKGLQDGTGLGLSQVYGFTRSSGGEVTIESTRGRGTQVTLCLPEAPAIPPELQKPLPVERPATAAGQNAQRLLLVDDNPDVRRATAEYLADVGYAVTEAGDAAQALVQLERDGADILLSDLVMPGSMNGLALAEEVRRRWPAVGIVIISGYSDSTSEAAELGYRLLPKPVDFDALVNALHNEARREIA